MKLIKIFKILLTFFREAMKKLFKCYKKVKRESSRKIEKSK